MTIQQISVFLENRSGHLSEITEALGGAGINLISLALADTNDFGIARIIVADVDGALKTLRDKGFTASVTDVIALAVPDVPGGLAKALKEIAAKALDIEYLYVARTKDEAIIIFRFDDTQRAAEILREIVSARICSASDIAAL